VRGWKNGVDLLLTTVAEFIAAFPWRVVSVPVAVGPFAREGPEDPHLCFQGDGLGGESAFLPRWLQLAVPPCRTR
jgi:hypothetical protein